ncbi:MAG: hypothetical protein GY780_01660 [bacterium]|nr:hypothetical protein [bacterium]
MRFAMLMLFLMLAIPAAAETVRVEFIANVEYNLINQGIFDEVNSQDDVRMTFTVDSENYIDSANYGVRAYPINMASYELTIGSVGPVALLDPQPQGLTPYFVVRNADPVADGFFISNSPEELYCYGCQPSLNVPGGIDPYFSQMWHVGYEGSTLDSLDILEAVGTYDYTGLTSYYCTIQDMGMDTMEHWYQYTVISAETVATENATWDGVKTLYR